MNKSLRTGNSEKYLAALQRFYRRSEKNLGAIVESCRNKDSEELTILVHALKSNARTIEIKRVVSRTED